MSRIKIWLQALRAPFFTAAAVPVFLGSAMGWHQTGLFNGWYFLLTLLGALFMHAGANLANDYFDYKSGADNINPVITPFSGGSRVIQKGLIPAEQIYLAALLCFGLGSIIGTILIFKVGIFILVLGMVGLLSGYHYTASPVKIGYRGWGEFLVGLNFGPLIVIGSHYVQARRLSLEALFGSLPLGLLISAVLYINEFPDYEADRSAGKGTLVVRMGRERAIKFYPFFLAFAYLVIILEVLFGLAPLMIVISLVTLPLAWKAFRIAKNHYNDTNKLVPGMAATIRLHLLMGALLSLGYLVDGILIKPL